MVEFSAVEFIKSAASADGFIRDGLPQAAFTGRSNVGKSSVINSLVRRKNYARVGASPGKTAHVNYFKIGSAYITDLPGYGFAKVSQAERDRWARLMESYFAADIVTCGVMIVDARHAPTADDVTMAGWYKQSGCPFVVVANKMDKLKKSEIEGNLSAVRQRLEISDEVRLIPYSAVSGQGRDALAAELVALLERR